MLLLSADLHPPDNRLPLSKDDPRGETEDAGLADQAGLETRDGRIVFDEQMRTSTPGLFAAGDVALARNLAAGRHLAVEHWGEALRMDDVAGRNAASGTDLWDDVPGFWSEIGDTRSSTRPGVTGGRGPLRRPRVGCLHGVVRQRGGRRGGAHPRGGRGP